MDEYKDFTLDERNFPEKEMQTFVKELHENHQHYVLILDPAIKVQPGYEAYEDGLKEDVFIKNPDGSVLVGKVWPGYVLTCRFQRLTSSFQFDGIP
jgi:alpha-glucosidase (family GH31 glycosyl hydrolase)